jgi:hypothetical protein
MKRILSLTMVLVVLAVWVFPLPAAQAQGGEDNTPGGEGISPLGSESQIIFPRNTMVFTATPKFRFTPTEGATKYRIDGWEGTDTSGLLLYTFKDKGTCNGEGTECWIKPPTALRARVYNGWDGNYFWRVRAKVNGEWPTSWSQVGFTVLSPGFNSTFDLNAKKWIQLSGTWTVTGTGYLKTKGIYDTTATILQQNMFANDLVYEVLMRRKVEASSTNRLLFMGDPGDSYVDGFWQDGYVVDYTNEGKWSLFVSSDYTKTYLVNEEFTTAIQPFGWNKVTVWCHNGEIFVWINKQYLGTYADSTYNTGYVGIGVFESDEASSPLLVDNAKTWYSNTAPYPIDI